MGDIEFKNNVDSKKPRRIMKVNHSPYDFSEAVHENKKYWNKVFAGMDASSGDICQESRRMAEVLPEPLYKRVCHALDIPLVSPIEEDVDKHKGREARRVIKEPMISYRKYIRIDREMDTDTDVECVPSDDGEAAKLNIHQEFLRKSEREQVTWATRYLQPEREDEKSLIKKADDLTDKIAQEFCQYMKELGGNQQSNLFTPKAIKELFQIEFDTHVARGLRVVTKELPSIEDKVATVTGNPEKSRYAALEREITKDIRAEEKPDNLTAFNQSLPLREQYRAPRNNTRKLWRSARHVPKDLVTLKAVWEGITNLRSVREYCRWMIDHPEHRKPPYLNSLGMFDPAVLNAKQSFQAKYVVPIASSDEGPAAIDNIRRRLSQLADSN